MSVRESRRRRRRGTGLLITPLIDIIFLLVIFFILNTSFRQERYIDVVLPESETSEDVQSTGIILTLREDGTAAVDGTEVSWEELTSVLKKRGEDNGAKEVIIRGDENISYGTAVAALDRARLAGFASISLQTVRTSRQ